MKRMILVGALTVAALLFGVSAASSSGLNLKTFGTGDVFVNGSKGATFNDDGEYGGFYRTKTSNRLLTDPKIDLSFHNLRAVGGGAPRFSIPIDEDNDGVTEAYAFIDVNGCGVPHPMNMTSTENTACQVFYSGDGGTYTNWDAFAAAHPTWRLAKKEVVGTKPNGKPQYGDTMPFIIADVTGDYLVEDIVLSY